MGLLLYKNARHIELILILLFSLVFIFPVCYIISQGGGGKRDASLHCTDERVHMDNQVWELGNDRLHTA